MNIFYKKKNFAKIEQISNLLMALVILKDRYVSELHSGTAVIYSRQ